MTTLSFPQNPQLNEPYTFEGRTWFWNGTAWKLNGASGVPTIFPANTLAGNLTGVAAPLTPADSVAVKTWLNLVFGTAADTYCQGNDARLTDSREWTATTISQAEAEAGSATTRRAFTAQRVRQAIAAFVSPLRPVIVTAPDDASVEVGQTATFSVTAATIANTHLVLTYQWQISTDSGTTWANISGATASSYVTPATEIGWDDYRYRCLVSNQLGTEITKVAILEVNAVSYSPSLDFTDLRNSMYISLLIEEF